MTIQEFSKKLIASGFRVWYHPHNRKPDASPTYLVAMIDEKFGYVGQNEDGGYVYSTVHRPCTSCGTGFRFAENVLNIELMRDCCHCFAPEWAKYYCKDVKKWSLAHWLKAHPTWIELT